MKQSSPIKHVFPTNHCVVVAALCAWALAQTAVHASEFDNGGGDNLWSNTLNWNPDAAPTGTITIAAGLAATSSADVSLGAGTTVLIGYNTNPYGIGSGPGGNGILNVTAGSMTFDGSSGQTFGMALGAAGQPQSGTLNISGSGTVSIQSGDLMVGWINATGEAVRGNGLIDVQTGGTLNIANAGNQCVGFAADGKLKISGGTVNQSGSMLRFSAGGGVISYFEMTGGAFNVNQEVRFGDAFSSFVGTQSGGAITKSAAAVGNLAMFVDNSPGSYVQTGGSIDVEDTVGSFNVGWNSQADLSPFGGQVYTLNGGSVTVGTTSQAGFRVAVGSLNATANVQSGSLTVGASSLYGLRLGETFGGAGNGSLNVSGGSVTVNGAGMWLGVDVGCTGTVNQTGGTVTLAAGLPLGVGNTPTSTGTYNLNGGTLTLSSVVLGGTGSAFNFGNGTLQNNGNITTVAPMNLTGSGTWDTAGYNATQSAVLSGSGGLTKAGAGILTLNGTNTYTGSTTISNGTLLVNGVIGIGAVAVKSGATLGGDGNVAGAVTVEADGILAPGTSISKLSLTNLTLAATATNVFEFDVAGSTNDIVDVGGDLTPGGSTIVVDISGGTLVRGAYRLFNYAGTKVDDFGSVQLRTGSATGNLGVSNAANQVNLIVSNSAPVANAGTYSRGAVSAWHISVADLLTNATDVDGDTLTLVSVGVSTNGITVYNDGTLVGYTNTNLVVDQFAYTVTDGFGGTNSGIITLTASNSVTGTSSIGSVVTGNPTTLTAYGISGETYITQRATNLDQVVWDDIATNTLTGTNVLISVTDSNPPSGSAFYRLKWQQP